jgi:hypothetical protein
MLHVEDSATNKHYHILIHIQNHRIIKVIFFSVRETNNKIVFNPFTPFDYLKAKQILGAKTAQK